MVRWLFVLGLAGSLAGCGSDSMVSAQFTGSATPQAPGLVKLVRKSTSGARVVVDAVVYGPEPGIDLFSFEFGVRIGNPDLVKFRAQATYPQSALVADAGQMVTADVDGMTDRSIVRIQVKKTGGAGNALPAGTAVVIELPFDVQDAGGTSLTLVGLGANDPRALDSHLAPIGAVRFDAASASVRGVTTGGGRY